MRSLAALLALLALHACSAATMEFVERADRLADDIAVSGRCSFWRGVLKLVRGKKDFCEEHLTVTALSVDSAHLLGLVWMLRSHDRLSQSLKDDLLAGLTTTPFWLNQGGSFENAVSKKALDHWAQDKQIVWLVGSYLVGDFFRLDANRSDLIFTGIDHTGLILSVEARHRVWRWLDHRQRFGFNAHSGNSVAALVTMAALAGDEALAALARISLYVAIFELQSHVWKESVLSPKIIAESRQDLSNLVWLLTGNPRLPVIDVSSSADNALVSTIVMLCAAQIGFDLPDLLVQESAFLQSRAGEITERFGTPRHSLRLPTTITSTTVLGADDCLDVLGADGLHSSLQCFSAVGHAFALWNRHPKWRILQSTGPDVHQLDIVLSSFSSRKGESVATTSMAEEHAVTSLRSEDSGHVSSDCQAKWKLHFPKGQFVATAQFIGKCLQVVPKVAQYNSTVFTINNPDMIVSAALNTGSTLAELRARFEQTYKISHHWFVGRLGNSFVALYSYNPVQWDSVTETAKVPGSHNVWICHVESHEEGKKRFDAFVERIVNSQLEVQETFRDGFEECLSRFRCLDGGANTFLECLRGRCNITNYAGKSQLADCIAKRPSAASSVPRTGQLVGLAHCLQRPPVDLELRWQLADTVFQFGWSHDLRVWRDNQLQNLGERPDLRYRLPSFQVKMASRQLDLFSNNAKLHLDFEQLKFKESHVN